MNSVKSARLNLVKFLFLLPMLIVLLLSFRQAQNKHIKQDTSIVALQTTDTVPPPPPPPPPNPPKKVDVKVKIPAPPAPPKEPTMSTYIDDKGDTLTASEIHVAISANPVLKTVTDVKAIASIEPKVETLSTITAKADVKTVVNEKVEVSGLKPITSIKTDIKPITSVMTADVMEVTKGGGEQVLVIKNTTTKQDLEQMKKDLESKGYEFTIKDASYSDDKVVSIKGTVRKGDDWGSFEATHFQKFVISYLNGKDSRFLVTVLHGTISFTNNAE